MILYLVYILYLIKKIIGICNEHQFKNLIRELNIGISNLEIDEIIKRSGRSYNGMINIKNFYKYVIGKDKLKIKIEDNISIIL